MRIKHEILKSLDLVCFNQGGIDTSVTIHLHSVIRDSCKSRGHLFLGAERGASFSKEQISIKHHFFKWKIRFSLSILKLLPLSVTAQVEKGKR